MIDQVPPPVRYARSGPVSIAYQVIGEGNAVDLVYAPGTASHLMLSWERPGIVLQIRRFSSFARLIRLDKRGTGMSDRVSGAATLEERTDDIRAVMDAAGSESAVILGLSEGGQMATLFAALYPERTRGLVVWGCMASWVRRAGHPWGHDPEKYSEMIRRLGEEWPSEEYVRGWGSGLGPDVSDAVVADTSRFFQSITTPGMMVALEEMNGQVDIRDALPTIRVPTLIMGRADDPIAPADAMRDFAARIPGAQCVLFPGRSHGIVGPGLDHDAVFAAIERFVTGSAPAAFTDRVLSTVLFLDLVGSTERAVQVGDPAWRSLLDVHYGAVRRELERSRGREVDTAGDGLLATFDGPAQAIRCAAAIVSRDRELGLSVRAGIHCGEVERAGAAIRGIAVHVAARVASLAAPDEILVSSTVRDLSAGSGIRFEERGTHALKGVPEPRQLFRAVAG